MDAPLRSLDVAQVASTDLVALNNTVVNMRNTVKSAKVQVIHKLTRYIRKLKGKKGSDMEKQKNLRKAERMLEEIFAIKALKADKVSKFALANTASFEDICKRPTTSTELRCLARLAEHKQLAKKVTDFRAGHADWPALTAYLMVKQTGRRFKTKKQKEATKGTAHANITASRFSTHSYLTSKLGASENIDKLLAGPRARKAPVDDNNTSDTGMGEQTIASGTSDSVRSGDGETRTGGRTQKQDVLSSTERQNTGSSDHSEESDDEVVESENRGEMFEEQEGQNRSSDEESNNDSDHERGKPWLNVQSDDEDGGNSVGQMENSDAEQGSESSVADDSDDSVQLKSIHENVDNNSAGEGSTDNENSSDGEDSVGDDNDDGEEDDDDENSSEGSGEKDDERSDDSEADENSDAADVGSSDDDRADKDMKRTPKVGMKKAKQKGVRKPDHKRELVPSLKKSGTRTEMVVKRIDLNSAEAGTIFTDSPSNVVPDILLKEAPAKPKMAKNPFFLAGEGELDSDGSSDNEPASIPRKSHRDDASDDDTPQQHEWRRLESGMQAMDSTFLDSLDSSSKNRHRSFGSFENRGRGFQPWNPRGRPFERPDRGRGGFRGRGRGSGGESWGRSHEGDLEGRNRYSSRDFQGQSQRGGFRGRGRGADDRGRGRGFDRGRGRGFDRGRGSSRGGRDQNRGSFQASRHSSNRGDAKTQPQNARSDGKGDEQVHPSWVASQKRKLQEQTTTFQGKRIKFDD